MTYEDHGHDIVPGGEDAYFGPATNHCCTAMHWYHDIHGILFMSVAFRDYVLDLFHI